MTETLSKFIKSFSSSDFTKTTKLFKKLRHIEKESTTDSLNLSTCKEYKIFKEEIKKIKSILQISFLEPWNVVRQEDNITIETTEISDHFYVKLNFEIPASPLVVLSIFYEIEKFPEWMNVIKSARIFEDMGSYRKKVHYLYNLPWPINNRESLLAVNCVPMPDLKMILLTSYTPADMKDFKSNEKYINMVVPCSGIWLKCFKNKTELTMVSEANEYIRGFPSWIINFIIKFNLHSMANSIIAQAISLINSNYLSLVPEKKKAFYEEIRNIMKLNSGS